MRRLIWPVLFLFLMLLQGSMSVYYTGWLSCDLLLWRYMLMRCCAAKSWCGSRRYHRTAAGCNDGGYFWLPYSQSYLCRLYSGPDKGKVFKDNYLYHMSAIATITFILRFVYWWLELLRSGGRWSIFLHIYGIPWAIL